MCENWEINKFDDAKIFKIRKTDIRRGIIKEEAVGVKERSDEKLRPKPMIEVLDPEEWMVLVFLRGQHPMKVVNQEKPLQMNEKANGPDTHGAEPYVLSRAAT